jgi:hypothetical protein
MIAPQFVWSKCVLSVGTSFISIHNLTVSFRGGDNHSPNASRIQDWWVKIHTRQFFLLTDPSYVFFGQFSVLACRNTGLLASLASVLKNLSTPLIIVHAKWKLNKKKNSMIAVSSMLVKSRNYFFLISLSMNVPSASRSVIIPLAWPSTWLPGSSRSTWTLTGQGSSSWKPTTESMPTQVTTVCRRCKHGNWKHCHRKVASWKFHHWITLKLAFIICLV